MEGLFLEEERSLFLEIIERLEKYIEHTQAEGEIKLRQEKLIQADKMVSLGFLVSGVAHEINNPNNFIRLNAPILKEAWESITPILEEYFNENGDFMVAGIPYSEIRVELPKLLMGILEGSERITGIVQELKDYARQETVDTTRLLNVNEVLETTLILLSNQIRQSTGHLTVTLGKNLPEVRGSFQRLEQVLVNLLLNACQALSNPRQGIFITTSSDTPLGGILVEIRDEGVGILNNDLKHIFDPFFTTKRDKGGTGLGLFICASIVRELGGVLTYDAKPGKGTRVKLVLPAAMDKFQKNGMFQRCFQKTSEKKRWQGVSFLIPLSSSWMTRSTSWPVWK